MVDSHAARIGFTALRDSALAIAIRINVITTAGKQYPLNAQKQPRNSILTLVKRHDNRCHSNGVQCSEIGWQGTLVVS